MYYLLMFKEERNEYFWHTLFCSDDLLPPNKQARATMQSCHGYNSNWSYLASASLGRDVTKKIIRQARTKKRSDRFGLFSKRVQLQIQPNNLLKGQTKLQCFCKQTLLPKNDQTNSVFLPNSTMIELFLSFFERIKG